MQESQENYLETILMLLNQNKIVRSIDVATALNYSKPSVSRAMKRLKEQGYINVLENGAIELTEKGLQKASSIYERHIIITEFLSNILGIDHEIAEKDACRIEHIISEETFQKLKEKVVHSNEN